MRRNRIIALSTTLTLLLALQPRALALPLDSQQAIEIEAEKMVMDQQNGISTYSGGVKLAQGSILIEAETLVVHMQNRKMDRLEAFGSDTGQASFRQQLANGEETRARAGHMEYRAVESRLILRQQAQLLQGGNHIQSERIDYNTDSNSLIAGQGSQQNPEQQRQRVRIVIEPDNENRKKTTEQKQP